MMPGTPDKNREKNVATIAVPHTLNRVPCSPTKLHAVCVDEDGEFRHKGETVVCDACPHCADVCSNPACPDCDQWRQRANGKALRTHRRRGVRLPEFTICQISRHNTIGSCWLVAGRDVFDASALVLDHPGGVRSILRKAGGKADTTEDLRFHSLDTQKVWRSQRVGVLARCPGRACDLPGLKQDGGCAVS